MVPNNVLNRPWLNSNAIHSSALTGPFEPSGSDEKEFTCHVHRANRINRKGKVDVGMSQQVKKMNYCYEHKTRVFCVGGLLYHMLCWSNMLLSLWD